MDSIKILVIDDEPLVSGTLRLILEEEGYQVTTAASGVEGLQRIEECSYNLVFLDLKLPDANGIEILKHIKKICTQVPIIIITGYATVESATTAIRLNAYDYILKPLELSQVKQSVKNVLRRKELERKILSAITKPRMLIVDSGDGTFDGIKEKLLQESIYNLCVGSGTDAIEHLKNDRLLTTILYDLNSPGMSGLDFLEAAKGINPELVFLPFTSSPDVTESVRLMKEGACDYLKKPVAWEDLLRPLSEMWHARSLSLVNKQLIYELQKINEELERSRADFHSIVEKSADGIIVAEPGAVHYMNPCARNMLGHRADKFIGESPELSLINGETAEIDIIRLTGLLGTGEVTIVDTLWNGQPSRLITIRDITERKRAQDSLRQSQKMEAIGKLSGEVADKLSKLVTSIQKYLETLIAPIDETDAHFKYLQEMKIATKRCLELAEQLLLFAGRQPIEMSVVNINSKVTEMLGMFTRIIGENITITSELKPETRAIIADDGLVKQILINLVKNASDAMPDGGDIRIATGNHTIDKESCASMPGAYPGKFVQLSVGDTGIGIDESAMLHIFEPFFTTKISQTATGLGLAVVYSIVQQHKGWVQVTSVKGKGSTFAINLPAAE